MLLIKKIIWLVVNLAILGLLSWNIQVWHNLVVSCLLLGAYLFNLAFLWSRIFQIKFNLESWPIVTWVLGLVVPILLISLAGAIFIAWYVLTPLISWWVLVFIAGLTWFFYNLIIKNQKQVEFDLEEVTSGLDWGWWRWLIIIGYVLGWVVSWFLLFKSKSEIALLSPWQAINPFFVILFFGLTIILLLLLFSKIKIQWLLVLILAHSLLTHGYLGFSHQLPYGGDVWRHLGVEKQLAAGQMIVPTLIGEGARTSQIFGINLPTVLIEPYKYIYSQYWAWQVMLNQLTNLSLLTIHRLALPLIWSLIIPILLFLIGQSLFKNDKSALILSLGSCLLFPWQSLGALSAPVALGLIMFLFGLWLLLSGFEHHSRQLKQIAWGWGLMMFFSYPLYLIIYGLSAIWLWFWHWQTGRPGRQIGLISFLIAIVSLAALPMIELVSGYSQLANQVNWPMVFKQIVSGLLGWHFIQLMPTDIFTFNWIFNQTPQVAFVSNIFIAWRGWVILVVILIWFLAGWGIIKSFTRCSAAVRAITSLAIILLVDYIFNWFWLSGERIFTRRLDLIISILIAFLVIVGVQYLAPKVSWSNNRWFIIGLAAVIGWFGVATYTSGPDLMVVSFNQYQLAEKIWQNSDQQTDHYCILASDQVILILEGVSGGKIVGGGFPVYLQYQQPERQKITTEFKAGVQTEQVIQVAKKLTNASQCLVAFDDKIIVY